MKKSMLFIMVLCFCVVLQAQTSKTITNLTAGGLKSRMTSTELSTVTHLTLSGTIDTRDFRTMRHEMLQLMDVDLTNVQIAAYTGVDGSAVGEYKIYPANALPEMAFSGNHNISTLALPISITSVGRSAFESCNRLTSVNLPSAVTTIGDGAFQNNVLLTVIALPASVISIGRYAFFNCPGLKSIDLPASVISIGEFAFTFTKAFITVDSENTHYSALEGVLFNKDKTELIQCPLVKTGDYTIPSSVNRIHQRAFALCNLLTAVSIPNSVTTIDDDAFKGCSGLTSLVLPNSVTRMGVETFCDCPGLTSVTLSESITSIRGSTFLGCTGLTSVIIPNSVTTIEGLAFCECSGLTSITIPNSVTTIGESVFYGCSGLTSVILPNSLTTIGESTFAYCSSLESIIIPPSVTHIGILAFMNCLIMRSLTLPTSLVTIEDRAFFNCSALTSVTIPASVTDIGMNAFEGCISLASIYAYPSTPVVLSPSSNVFKGVDTNTCMLNVPAGSLNLYKSAEVWKDFFHIGMITSSGKDMKNEAISVSPNPAKDVVTIHAQKGVASIFNSNGRLVITQSLEKNNKVNLSSLQPGMYVVVVNGESFKMIKE